VSACGSSTNKTTSTTVAPAATTTTTAASPKTVATATSATLGTILVDSKGRTLYHNTKESGSTIVCTAACATTWPPLTIAAGTSPTWAAGLTGSKFSTVARADGTTQVGYANWPLYTYSGDTKAGDTNGQGVGGVWYAVTAAGTNAAAAGSTATTTGGATATTTTGSAATTTTGAAATTTTAYSYGSGY
jgi:predicted lipoprotein with Yx(FWY)xxD motif